MANVPTVWEKGTAEWPWTCKRLKLWKISEQQQKPCDDSTRKSIPSALIGSFCVSRNVAFVLHPQIILKHAITRLRSLINERRTKIHKHSEIQNHKVFPNSKRFSAARCCCRHFFFVSDEKTQNVSRGSIREEIKISRHVLLIKLKVLCEQLANGTRRLCCDSLLVLSELRKNNWIM